MIKLLNRILRSPISPMVYVLMFVSSFIGFCFMTGLIIGGTESVLYGSGVLVDRVLWGALLHFSATGGIVGLLIKNDSLISIAGIFGFMLWLFACISLALTGHVYAFVATGLLHLAFHAYVVLANSMDLLVRR